MLLEVAHDKDALYLCGDTAQTISRGVGFRFADVRSLFHAHCERGEAAMPTAAIAAVARAAAGGGGSGLGWLEAALAWRARSRGPRSHIVAAGPLHAPESRLSGDIRGRCKCDLVFC